MEMLVMVSTKTSILHDGLPDEREVRRRLTPPVTRRDMTDYLHREEQKISIDILCVVIHIRVSDQISVRCNRQTTY